MAVGRIWVQAPLLGPSVIDRAGSTLAQGVPRGCSRLPPRDRDLSTPVPSSLGSRPRFCTGRYSIRATEMVKVLEHKCDAELLKEPGGSAWSFSLGRW